jgi:putative PIG3 family NAD(P)H quinone oxidoreductase
VKRDRQSAVPDTATVIEISNPGGPDALRPASRAVPVPGSGEVLIHVAAAGVNRPDLMQRQGKYPPPAGASDIPGLEVAGTIVSAGDDTGDFKPGDQVCALVSGGGYAEYCVAPALQCLPIPRGLSLVEAAALPETVFTVWVNVFERGHLQPGETLLVHGGTSGIGTIAIQLAHALGARVLATAGTDEKVTACERLGAERGINYRTEDFVEVVREVTGGRGADVVLDMVGGDYVNRNLQLAALDGRIVNIAFQQGFKTEVDFTPLLLKRLTLSASTLRPRSAAAKAAIAAALERSAWPLLAAGRIRPVIAAEFPLAQAPDAHRLMESSRHIGKILLRLG